MRWTDSLLQDIQSIDGLSRFPIAGNILYCVTARYGMGHRLLSLAQRHSRHGISRRAIKLLALLRYPSRHGMSRRAIKIIRQLRSRILLLHCHSY